MDKLNLIILIMLALVVSIPASAAITHRYSFDNDANDVVGGLESTLVGDAAVTDGELVLDGDGDWLEMDAAGTAINTYTTGLTLELWHTQDETDQDFSMTAAFGETDDVGRDYVMIATTRGDSVTSAAIANNEPDDTDPWTEERWINYPQEFNDDTEHHYVLTVDDPLEDGSGRLAFYIDGEAVEVDEGGQMQYYRALNGTLVSELSNATAYLGRGVYDNDGSVRGQIDEFRIHDRGLNPGEVIFTNYFGPDNPYPLVLRDLSPAYDDPEVIEDDLDPDLDITFSWTVEPSIAADVDYFNIYIGTDPNIADPNKAESSHVNYSQTLIPASPHTVDGGTLDNLKNYYWRVDTVMDGGTVYQGAGMTFTTLPADPYFILQPDVYTFTKADTTISVTAGNTTEYQWYKVVGEQDNDENEETDDTPLSNTGVYSTTQTATLTITGIDNDAEGYYYCEISNGVVDVDSNLARLVKAELKSQYKMETITVLPDGNSITPDSAVAAYDMVLQSAVVVDPLNGDDGLDYAVLDPNVTDGIASIAGTDSLLFNNSNQNDPNNAWGQYATLPQGVVNYEDITIALWVYPRYADIDGDGNVNEWMRIFDFGNGTDDYIFLTPDAGGGGLRLAMRINGGGEQQLNSGYLPSGSWYHVAVTLEGDTGRLFVNGDEVASNTSMTLNPTDFNPADNLIADSQYEADPYFNGALDDIRIYSYALTPAEVAGLYTEVKTSDYVCVEDPENPIDYDLNDDCRVDLEDVAALAGRWLDCERIPTDACGWAL